MTRYIYPNLRFKKYAKYGEPVTLAHTRKLFKAALKFSEPVHAFISQFSNLYYFTTCQTIKCICQMGRKKTYL